MLANENVLSQIVLNQQENNFIRTNVEFDADGILLKGWLYQPYATEQSTKNYPALVMAGGFGTTKEMYTDKFAERFASAGFMVLLYDHRGFGCSGGMPRQEINPWQQVEDLRHAITYMTSLSSVAIDRIGIWGSSYSGGHAIVVGATDRRVKCVAIQVPTVSGTKTALRRVSGEAESALFARFADDRLRRANGKAATLIPLMGDDKSGAIYKSKEAIDWYTMAYSLAPDAKPEVTLRSVEFARAYNPIEYIERVSPTPLLMQVAEKDYVTPTDLSLEAYRNALEPKSLKIISGAGHFDVYIKNFEEVSLAALEWYEKHLSVSK